MGTYQDCITVAASTVFQARVQHALDAASLAVYNEDPSFNPAQHERRARYAVSVFDGTANLYGAARAVIAVSTIATECGSTLTNNGVTDAELATAISSVYNLLAAA